MKAQARLLSNFGLIGYHGYQPGLVDANNATSLLTDAWKLTTAPPQICQVAGEEETNEQMKAIESSKNKSRAEARHSIN